LIGGGREGKEQGEGGENWKGNCKLHPSAPVAQKGAVGREVASSNLAAHKKGMVISVLKKNKKRRGTTEERIWGKDRKQRLPLAKRKTMAAGGRQ